MYQIISKHINRKTNQFHNSNKLNHTNKIYRYCDYTLVDKLIIQDKIKYLNIKT